MYSLTPLDHDSNPEKLKDTYNQILKSNGIQDSIFKVTAKDPGLQGEGVGSYRRNVTVEFENPNLPPLTLFIKMQVRDNPTHLALTRGTMYFEKESLFLTTYVAEAKELCSKKGLNESFVTDIYPKCYYADDRMVVMENLKVGQGYEILGKTEPHDWDITTFSLKTLAKHHAISYAMIHEAGGPDDFFKKYPVFNFEAVDKDVWAAYLNSWMQSNVNLNMLVLKMNCHVDGAAEALKSLEEMNGKKSTLSELCATSMDIETGDLLLLGHGDYWFSNMLFLKDPANGKIIQQKAIDLQGIRYNSPAIDLAYYMLISVNTELRQARFCELLQYYISKLQKFADDIGHPIELDVEALVMQYRKKLHLGFLMAMAGRYGPGAELMKSIDYTKVTGDWGEFLDIIGTEWIHNNKAEAEKIAVELVSVMKEYKNLVIY